MNKKFLVADTHFNHAKILEYTKRPFQNVNEMNDYIIKQWNSVVSENDIVYHLGDFGFGSVEDMAEIYNKLNGYKILIIGNHDRARSITWWRNLGFDEVYKKPINLTYDNIDFSLSHEPKDIEEDIVNLHGHIHNKDLDTKNFNPNNHICVSVECIDYKPIDINNIVKKLFEDGDGF